MKKPGHSHRRPSGKSGGNQNATSNRPSRGSSSNRRSRPNSSQGHRAKAVEQWMTAPSQTLSSHISIISKRNAADNSSNNSFNKNGKGGSSTKVNDKNKTRRDRSRQNGPSAGHNQRKNNYPNKARRKNETPARGGSSPRPTDLPRNKRQANLEKSPIWTPLNCFAPTISASAPTNNTSHPILMKWPTGSGRNPGSSARL